MDKEDDELRVDVTCINKCYAYDKLLYFGYMASDKWEFLSCHDFFCLLSLPVSVFLRLL